MRSVLLFFPFFQTIGLRDRGWIRRGEKQKEHLSLLCVLKDYTVLPKSERFTFQFLGNIIHSTEIKINPYVLMEHLADGGARLVHKLA